MTQIKNFPFSLQIPEALKTLEDNKKLTFVNVGNAMAKSFLLAELVKQSNFKNIFWASAEEKAESLHLNAELFFGENIVFIPEKLDMQTYYDIQKRLMDGHKNLFLFEGLEAILTQRFPTKKTIKSAILKLKVGDTLKIYDFFGDLEERGYVSAEDQCIKPGEFVKRGDQLFIYPINERVCYRIDLFGDRIENIENYPQGEIPAIKLKKFKQLSIYAIKYEKTLYTEKFQKLLEGQKKEQSCFIADDLDKQICPSGDFYRIKFTTFPEEDEQFIHLNFFSVLPFYTIPDFVMDIKERFHRDFSIVVMTKKYEEIKRIFRDNDIMFTENLTEDFPSTVKLIKAKKEDFLPHSFQNNDRKMLFLTDREIFQFKRSTARKKSISGMNFELMNSLKDGDYVVHLDHGIAKYEGIVRREINKGEIREYLKLAYLNNDRLFVPVDSAEKVSKYVGDDEPRRTKLGGTEWSNLQKKLRKETEKIAKELLQLYAKRELAKGKKFKPDSDKMLQFYSDFPYTLTPGQHQAWEEVRADMERPKPVDRLVCGDVGFGKTEIAMRAAFKAFCSGYQCVILAPITILAEQHYQSFMKRVAKRDYGLNLALLSRFQSPAEQKEILKKLAIGAIDIVIGTHRLLSDDVKFKNLGLVIIDEEQRFGVKQKEKLKKLRSGVDMLTLTATPIPRTLHMGLNKLKDISTITTPPPGRLPVVTEVRRYSLDLIRERILYEKARGGQVYFLHNQVQTIESQTEQMRQLMPDIKFVVAHGQMSPHDLEARIKTFKEGKADVLVASTIIENGIDLPNANTLLVNRAEKFGLSQLYQLRGRVGRGRTQAYAFFLYQGQKLAVDAKKRLRAIVEASELGSGFQIAMRDLEIRGAGEILGANQSGTMKDTGVSHFIRMLNQTVEKMKSGEQGMEEEEEENITVEIPLSAYIPPSYIPNADEKIQVYQEIAGMENLKDLKDYVKDLEEDYGILPREVENLCRVIKMKIALKSAHLAGIRLQKKSHKEYEIIIRLGKHFTPDQIFTLIQNSPRKWVVTANALRLNLDKLPVTWYRELLEDIRYLEKKTAELPKKEKK